MNPAVQHLFDLSSKSSKSIIGLMSGTSLDGLDIALCRIEGAGSNTLLELSRFNTFHYPFDVVEKLRHVVSVEKVLLEELCLAHTWLADYHADLILETLMMWGVEPAEIDCIASHGQTVYHAPYTKHQQQGFPNSTLQIVDGDHIARRTGILTLSDFRQKHTAAGGEGAPMASLVDKLLYTDKEAHRILLNIGGIANFSFLPAEESEAAYVTTDTGPGNTLVNAATQEYMNREYDEDGKIAASGTISADLLKVMKQDPYFARPLPKTTGPELFNLQWVDRMQERAGVPDITTEDLIATLTWLSAETIADAIKSVTGRIAGPVPVVYLSGGGMHNKTMMRWLKELLEGYTVESFETIGYNPDAKEAASFAVLANEILSGEGFLINPKNGAERRVNFGKVSFPV